MDNEWEEEFNALQDAPPNTPSKVEFKIIHAVKKFDILMEKLTSPPPPFTWGLKHLDESFPVIERNRYIVLFGQAGSGKTQFALHMAIENSHKLKVLFVSLEMSSEQMFLNYILKRGKVTNQQYKERDVPLACLNRLEELSKIDFICAEDIMRLKVADLKEFIDENQYDMVFIDNFNKLDSNGESENEQAKEISDQLQNLARTNNIALFVIHHANKPSKTETPNIVEERKLNEATGLMEWSKPPSSSSLELNRLPFRREAGMRGSQKIMDDVDQLIEVVRPTFEYTQSEFVKEKREDANRLAGIRVFKDRDRGIKAKEEMYLVDGRYYELDTDIIQENNSLDDVTF